MTDFFFFLLEYLTLNKKNTKIKKITVNVTDEISVRYFLKYQLCNIINGKIGIMNNKLTKKLILCKLKKFILFFIMDKI